ncbi:DUF2505 domain-containing protein [Kineococcus gynurae]|uniref:DUF2505 domain-containing protein n=1 Tax=Kineococcus gynurae TaxID=452979 RepID=A0ABV5LXC8_9ACTN
MRVHDSALYPGPPDAVVAVLTDPTFVAERARASGALEQSCDVTDVDGTTVVTSRLVVGTDQLPDVARRVVGSSTIVRSTESWRPASAAGGRTGTLALEVQGAPARLEADLTLTPVPEGSRYDLDGTLTVRVPLFGAAVERAVEPLLMNLLRSHADLLRRRLV